jgi:hypothetical protein
VTADPTLDRIAAAVESGYAPASPAVRELMNDISGRFVEDLAAIYRGDLAELGAVMLSIYAKATAMAERMGPATAIKTLSFYLSFGGTRLYLRRDQPKQAPAPQPQPANALLGEGLYMSCGISGPWLRCRLCTGEDRLVAGFDERVDLADVLAAAREHRDHAHPGRR